MAIKKREAVTKEELERVAELRSKGLTRNQIAEAMGITWWRVMYVVKFLPSDVKKPIIRKKKLYYTKERKTFTDAMPNPFPKWWTDSRGLDHNFYRPRWKK